MAIPSIKHPQPRPASHSLIQMATVSQVLSLNECLLNLANESALACLASHVNCVMPGQQVLVIHGKDISPLVIAAYPPARINNPDRPNTHSSLMSWDEASGQLVIEANSLSLRGVTQVELRCGEAVLRLTAQSEILSQAQAITQAAIGPYRIEGASIDLN